MNRSFLKVKGPRIVDVKNQRVTLQGVNFGGWLMMEGYFMHTANTAEQFMKKEFAGALGKRALADLEESFRRNFIQESDVRQVKAWGFNCVRLPFNYRLLHGQGIRYLDEAVGWANTHGVYLILDLHAAPGAQNTDWHSDSPGKAELWTKKSNRHRTYEIWERLADRYKNEPMVAGYDLLNEPVLENTDLLNEYFRETIKAVRRSDKNHILFIEGNRWAQDIGILDNFREDNLVYSVHFYEPLEFTFNFVPHLAYPLKSGRGLWDKDTMRRRMEAYDNFARARNRPVHVGEFGVNDRGGKYNEHLYVKNLVGVFREFGFHWNYWTYKAVKHYTFPDGIYSYYPNPPWVNRGGVVTGWNRWKDLWGKHRDGMINSWKTAEFTLNEKIFKSLT